MTRHCHKLVSTILHSVGHYLDYIYYLVVIDTHTFITFVWYCTYSYVHCLCVSIHKSVGTIFLANVLSIMNEIYSYHTSLSTPCAIQNSCVTTNENAHSPKYFEFTHMYIQFFEEFMLSYRKCTDSRISMTCAWLAEKTKEFV